jgi:hypothetical protein
MMQSEIRRSYSELGIVEMRQIPPKPFDFIP